MFKGYDPLLFFLIISLIFYTIFHQRQLQLIHSKKKLKEEPLLFYCIFKVICFQRKTLLFCQFFFSFFHCYYFIFFNIFFFWKFFRTIRNFFYHVHFCSWLLYRMAVMFAFLFVKCDFVRSFSKTGLKIFVFNKNIYNFPPTEYVLNWSNFNMNKSFVTSSRHRKCFKNFKFGNLKAYTFCKLFSTEYKTTFIKSHNALLRYCSLKMTFSGNLNFAM